MNITMRWSPHITVATIVEDKGRFLMVEEWSGDKLVYNQPAGHVEENETFEEAAIRETLEETGWDVELKSLLGIYVYTSHRNNITYQRLCYIATPKHHHPERKLDTGIERALWLTLDEIKADVSKQRSPLVEKCVQDYLGGQSFPLKVIWHYPS
jgi:8-oxo-dGTP pyrophosphatase MutT (NUDIX family)